MVGLSNGVINLFESSALQIANGAQLTENKVDFFINPKEDTNNSLMKKCAPMAGLNNNEIRATQAYIDSAMEELSTLGLSLTVSCDAYEWRKLLENAPGVRPLASTFDPDPNDIRNRDMFWIAFRNDDGEAIACVGSRFVETDDFVNEWVTTWRIFGDRTPYLNIQTMDYIDPLPTFKKRIGYGGGLWVHPEWRGNDLAARISRLARVVTLRHFCADYYTVFVECIPKKLEWARKTLGWPNGANLCHGYYPARDDVIFVAIFWAGREEILTMCRRNELGIQDRLLKRTA